MSAAPVDPPFADEPPWGVFEPDEDGAEPRPPWADHDSPADDAGEHESEAEPANGPLTIAQHAEALAKYGAAVRVPTGIATLDNAMRGGLPLRRRFVVVGGAPGAGKTSLVCRLAYQWAKAGIVVGILAVDEGPEGIVDRCALYEGASRARLDAGDPCEWARLGTALRGLPLIVDDGGMTVGAFAAHLRKVAGDRPAVVIPDSIQTVRAEAEGARAGEGKREQIDRVVRALKRASVEHGLLVLATCELSRAYYRSDALAKELNPLAAFKESGSIEYAAQTALVLTSPKGEHSLIDVTVAKNRGHRKEPFRLQLHSDLSFNEVERPAEEATNGRATTSAKETARRQEQEARSKDTAARKRREAEERQAERDERTAAKVERDRQLAEVILAGQPTISARAFRVEMLSRGGGGSERADAARLWVTRHCTPKAPSTKTPDAPSEQTAYVDSNPGDEGRVPCRAVP